jgi:Cytochrome C assembly protein
VFDLERRIQQWRQTAAETLGDRPEVMDELEGHLREEMQRLVQSGQAPELAWEAALQRLGEPGRLAEEFAKVPPGPWLPARLVGLVLVVLSAGLAWFLLSALGRGRFGPLLACHIFAVTLGYTVTLAVGVLAGWSILARAVAGRDARRAEAFRSAAWKLSAAALGLTAVGVALGAWWAQDNLGRFWTWDPREFGGLGVLTCDGVLLACLLRRRAALPGMVLGVLGNMVVSLGWFGPPLLAVTLHSYGFTATLAFLLVGFLMTQLLLLLLTFVPPGRLARRQAG